MAIRMVVGHNNEAGIRYLLERGANPSFGPEKYTPDTESMPVLNSGSILNKAASVCSLEVFALLLSHGSKLSDEGAIPLHYAAGHPPSQTFRIPMLKYLVDELGLDVNSVDDAIAFSTDGRGQMGTPLHYAIECGHVEEVKWLLSRGADPDLKPSWGISARDSAKRLPPSHAISALFAEMGPKP